MTATRSEQRIEDAPVRVEVLAREEVEEKMMMTPGDVSMMLNETSGLRVQTTSPSLGGANVRVQGLRGRYTQILSDGLPLYGGQSGSLGLLQIPPMDLGQVEVIKGAASALYGASALGGVVNLVSRRPAGDRELLLNATHAGRRGRRALVVRRGWAAAGDTPSWAAPTASAAPTWTSDGWADLPRYARGVVRPRLFWDGGEGRSLFVTVGAHGGGPRGRRPAPRRRAPCAEELRTRRGDAGLVGRWLTGGGTLLHLRASAMAQRHDHRFGDVRERDRHATWFGEASAARTLGAHTLVAGAAVQREAYRAPRRAGLRLHLHHPRRSSRRTTGAWRSGWPSPPAAAWTGTASTAPSSARASPRSSAPRRGGACAPPPAPATTRPRRSRKRRKPSA